MTVDQEADTFPRADRPQALGHDVGVTKGVGGAGVVVPEKKSIPGADRAVGGTVADDVAEALPPARASIWSLGRPGRGVWGSHVTSWAQRKPITALVLPQRYRPLAEACTAR